MVYETIVHYEIYDNIGHLFCNNIAFFFGVPRMQSHKRLDKAILIYMIVKFSVHNS